MFDYEFTYQQHHIKLVNSGIGKESLYVNDELISTAFNWKFVSEHMFELNNNQMKIQLKVTSMLKGKLTCSLFENDVLIEAQDHTHSDLPVLGAKERGFKPLTEQERQWTEELEMSKSTTTDMYVLYFAMIAYGLFQGSSSWAGSEKYAFYVILGTLMFAIFEFCKVAVVALLKPVDKESDNNTPEEV
jgi:hypothetical protein